MSTLFITLLRFGFLLLLWLFILFMLITIRNDVFGNTVTDRRQTRKKNQRAQAASAAHGKNATLSEKAAAPQLKLVVTQGPLTGTALPLGTQALLIGRSPDSALVLDDGYASSRHARVYYDAGYYYVEDLNSTNGTWVGQERIHHPIPLNIGTPITIGKTVMELRS
ncbi:pSer/pThr/pTyr-binding forkhead associated (FHA) protein [Arcanobacterium pluranimalium]|uniref:FHA domain-containing protein FhaB/FipA n=1 Tax=Arcanobacterium pluranimalium TaxID=108028 RepID=UPI00195E55E4|nr:FHA domain-containing protein [Arcanobacterium pluranimalium]MBM7824418.1 pSer/pThr/pTyr-binding forkhead associated (FHA) protein [Arcanobacterium pluranimalium]